MALGDSSEAHPPLALLRFGVFELDVRSGELRKAGQLVKIQQQPAKVLALLAGRGGELVTRDEIRRQVWGEETFVDFDQGLNFCIKQIRSALGDQAGTPRFVETLPRRGYRFIAPVERVAPPPPVDEKPTVAAPVVESAPPPRRRRLGAAAGIAAALALGLYAAHALTAQGHAASERIGIAVLPFDNLSGDPQQDVVCDALADELITQLGRRRPERLAVIARTSSMAYKGSKKTVSEVGRELAIDYVVEGGVRRANGRVRVTAQLVRASDQTEVWAEGYERPDADLIGVQHELAERVAQAVEGQLVPEPAPAARQTTP